MNLRAIFKDILMAFFAQGIALLSSAATSLLVPKVLGIIAFGYWQLFIFYSTYVGFFHFGLNDGAYLLSGGQTRDNVDRARLNSQFLINASVQICIAVLIVSVAPAFSSNINRQWILIAAAVFLIFKNLTDYWGLVLQALNETRKYSLSVVVNRVTFFFPMLLLVLIRSTNFMLYVIAYVLSQSCSLCYCLFQVRSFAQCGLSGFMETLSNVRESINVGFPLMIASLASMMILGVAQETIDICWGISTFGMAALALSLTNVMLVFITQISMVLFPKLRQASTSERASVYRWLRDLLSVILPVAYLCYFPISYFIGIWLPRYLAALPYFAILLPICIFEGKMDLCCTTYFKVLRKERTLLRINIFAVCLSAFLAAIGALVFNSVIVVLLSVPISIFVRLICSERRIDEIIGVRTSSFTFKLMALTVIFLAICLNLDTATGFILTLVAYVGYLYLERANVKPLAHMLYRICYSGRR